MPTVEELRAAARLHGVQPSDADLELVQAFLCTILPALAEIEARNGPEHPPAGLFLPPAELP